MKGARKLVDLGIIREAVAILGGKPPATGLPCMSSASTGSA